MISEPSVLLTPFLIERSALNHHIPLPLALAEATLQALENGQPKLTRSQVLQIVGQV